MWTKVQATKQYINQKNIFDTASKSIEPSYTTHLITI